MKLEKFIQETGIPILELARRLDVNARTIYNILDNHDMRLSIALKIEKFTKGAVTCHDLYDESLHVKKPKEKKKKKKA